MCYGYNIQIIFYKKEELVFSSPGLDFYISYTAKNKPASMENAQKQVLGGVFLSNAI